MVSRNKVTGDTGTLAATTQSISSIASSSIISASQNNDEDVPTGLQILQMEEYCFIKVSINFTGFYENVLNTYEIYDVDGNRIIIAIEIGPKISGKRCNMAPCTWNICSCLSGYKFTIPIVSSNGVEIMRLSGHLAPKKFRCKIRAKVVVENDSEIFGRVIEEPDEPNKVRCYSVLKGATNSEVIYIIKSTIETAAMIGSDMSEAEFFIYNPSTMEKVGKISMCWSNLLEIVFPSATETFGIHLPNCSAKMKAVLIGAMFLINYQFYERKKFVVGSQSWQIFDE